jgi:hypothetical protein
MPLQENCTHLEETLKITIPDDLKTIWLNEQFNEPILSFSFHGFGMAQLFKAYNVLYRELSDFDYYNPRTHHLINALYFKFKDGSISEKQYESLKKRLDEDPLVSSIALTREIGLFFPHLNIKTCLVFAKVNRYPYLFYGYDSGGKLLGVYLWEPEGEFTGQMELPLFIDFSIKGIIPNYRSFPEGTMVDFDRDAYVKKQLDAENFIHITGSNGPLNDERLTSLLQFYKDRVEYQSGGVGMIFSVNKKIATIKITIPVTERSYLLLINFNENDLYFNLEHINTQLNFLLNDMPRKRPVDHCFNIVSGGLLCYLNTETAMDFAQKGVMKVRHLSLPYDAFAPH